MSINNYYDEAALMHLIKDGQHRQVIGDMWDDIGSLQFTYTRDAGLRPAMDLDKGCRLPPRNQWMCHFEKTSAPHE